MNINYYQLKNRTNAYIFGNGTSRIAEVLPERLKRTGILVGCNQIYKEFNPDFIVATDETQVKLIKESKFNGFLVHRDGEQNYFKLYDMESKNVTTIFRDVGCASGALAMRVGCEAVPDNINVFLFGFDLYSDNNVVNNIYAGEEGYVDKFHPPIVPDNFINQMKDIFCKYSGKNFYRVGRENDPTPKEWLGSQNIYFISYNQFYEKLKIVEHFSK